MKLLLFVFSAATILSQQSLADDPGLITSVKELVHRVDEQAAEIEPLKEQLALRPLRTIQTGTGGGDWATHPDGPWTLNRGTGQRQYDQQVAFAKPFSHPAIVTLGLTHRCTESATPGSESNDPWCFSIDSQFTVTPLRRISPLSNTVLES